ncbi:fibronectin type III domain-containing protein 11-like [Plectropomus leopardus]|uniref:fibronectin type III domain-containing protein 11-like n=1 Tax=Plectropomus leopardus TaxID=160734 RepID=UPI001C4B310B|nr:fibronectin type III domain-containing protein 11-like [Plectropomus leopardus]
MDEVMQAGTSSDECESKEVSTQMDSLTDLRNQILQLLCTTLSDHSFMVIQKELQVMQRSSYYLKIECDDLQPSLEEEEPFLDFSDSSMWHFLEQRRLQHAWSQAHTHVKILIYFLGMLYKEIFRGCRELEAFIVEYNQGLVDSDTAASIKQKLQQTHQYVNKFKRKVTWNIGPLNLQKKLFYHVDNIPIQLSASVVVKMPVIFNRLKSCVTSTAVHLFWDVEGEQSQELDQQFEIHIKSLQPTNAEQGQLTSCKCQSYDTSVNELVPDTYYEFSVQRADAVNLVYGWWLDTITLKTLDIPS